jgi:hypothetical protein
MTDSILERPLCWLSAAAVSHKMNSCFCEPHKLELFTNKMSGSKELAYCRLALGIFNKINYENLCRFQPKIWAVGQKNFEKSPI